MYHGTTLWLTDSEEGEGEKRLPEAMEKRRIRLTQIQRKRGKTETESSPQAIYGWCGAGDAPYNRGGGWCQVTPFSPLFLCLFLALSLFLLLWLLFSWLTALYLHPQTSHLQRNYPRGRHQLTLHSTAVGGGVQRKEADGVGEEGQRWGQKMLLSVCFLEIPHRTTVRVSRRLFVSRWLRGKQQVLHMGCLEW